MRLNPEAEPQSIGNVKTAEGATSAEPTEATASGSTEAEVSLTLGGLTVGAVESGGNETRRRVSIGLDSGAELMVWPPNLIPEVETKPSKDSRSGTKYYGPGDVHGPTLANQGKREYFIDSSGVQRKSKVQVVDGRKPLLAICDLEDNGHNICIVNGNRYAEHKETGERIKIHRRGGRYELDGDVLVLAPSRQCKP